MGLLSNINSGITIGNLGTNIALKYSKSQYQEKIDKLDNCARKLEQHLSNLEGYKEQLKSIWDDEYAAKLEAAGFEKTPASSLSAIYKKTSRGEIGWQRCSNIAFIELYKNNSSSTSYFINMMP